MKYLKRIVAVVLSVSMLIGCIGCGTASNVESKQESTSAKKRIIRIAHSQAETHPEHIGLLKFKEYVEEKLGDKYEVQIFPNELLGSQTKAIELTQTGAIDFVLVGTPNLENFAKVYEIFSMPYLFTSEEAYHAAMNDESYMKKIYESTDDTGLRVVTWYNVGTRNFYAKKAIKTPDDLKGLKIRVQQSPASVNMANAFGAAASPMSFGEVYTAIQQGVIDGAENNELALTSNKHGEVAKYFSYNKHQMVPDILVANLKFLNGLSKEDRAVFEKAAKISTQVEQEEWDKQVKEAKEYAQKEMGVKFLDVDVQLFRKKVLGVQKQMLKDNESIRDSYKQLQTFNKKYEDEAK